MASAPIYVGTIKNGAVQIVNADGTTLKTLYTAGSSGSTINSIMVTSTDTSNRDIQLFLYDGSTSYLLGTYQILANSGNTNAIVTVDLLKNTQNLAAAFDALGNKTINLQANYVLKVGLLTGSVTAAKALNFVCYAGDF